MRLGLYLGSRHFSPPKIPLRIHMFDTDLPLPR